MRPKGTYEERCARQTQQPRGWGGTRRAGQRAASAAPSPPILIQRRIHHMPLLLLVLRPSPSTTASTRDRLALPAYTRGIEGGRLVFRSNVHLFGCKQRDKQPAAACSARVGVPVVRGPPPTITCKAGSAARGSAPLAVHSAPALMHRQPGRLPSESPTLTCDCVPVARRARAVGQRPAGVAVAQQVHAAAGVGVAGVVHRRQPGAV